MDDKTLQKHYERVMLELESEKLMTFEELANITKLRPDVLKRTIPVLAHGLCCYQKYKAELMEDQDLNKQWVVQDMQEKRGRAMLKYYKKAPKQDENIVNKENIVLDGKEDFISDFGEQIVCFEDLVRLTGTHPFYLERCLCHLAILAETGN